MLTKLCSEQHWILICTQPVAALKGIFPGALRCSSHGNPFSSSKEQKFFSCPSTNAESGGIWVAVRLLATYILEGMIYSITTTANGGFSTATSPHLDDR
jgi:hypothetical protein